MSVFASFFCLLHSHETRIKYAFFAQNLIWLPNAECWTISTVFVSLISRFIFRIFVCRSGFSRTTKCNKLSKWHTTECGDDAKESKMEPKAFLSLHFGGDWIKKEKEKLEMKIFRLRLEQFDNRRTCYAVFTQLTTRAVKEFQYFGAIKKHAPRYYKKNIKWFVYVIAKSSEDKNRNHSSHS